MKQRASDGIDLPPLIEAVQKNCDIADARHAGDLTLCTFLLRMRDFYCWENDLPPGRKVERDEVGNWAVDRERHWQTIDEEAFGLLPLPGGAVDPFDGEKANALLAPAGMVYSGGYGARGRPQFFLGELLRSEVREGCDILISGCEYARDVEAQPAMLLGRTVFVRTETLRRWLWDKVEEWRWSRKNEALGRALAGYGFDTDGNGDADAALDAMLRTETESVILHELGEASMEERFGAAWPAMLGEIAGTRAEIEARALRDLCADCVSTLPALLAQDDPAPVHFHFANFTGMRRELEPDLAAAYRVWVESRDAAILMGAAEKAYVRAWERAQALLDARRREAQNA